MTLSLTDGNATKGPTRDFRVAFTDVVLKNTSHLLSIPLKKMNIILKTGTRNFYTARTCVSSLELKELIRHPDIQLRQVIGKRPKFQAISLLRAYNRPKVVFPSAARAFPIWLM